MTVDVDTLARQLGHCAAVARRMPPAWSRARICQPLVGPRGERLGSMLPGEGLYLDCDLKRLGIHRRIPHVLERSPLQRAFEVLSDSAGGFTTSLSWTQAFANGLGQKISAYRGAAPDNGVWFDLFQIPDANGVSNTLPNGTLDQTTPGALSANLIAPVGTNTAYLLSFGLNPVGGGGSTPNGYTLVFVADLLSSITGLDFTTNAAQPVNTAALTRYTNGAGVMLGFESTAGGATPAGTFTASYTNQSATAGQVTPAQQPVDVANPGESVLFNAALTLFVPYATLQAGDSGVRSVQSVTYTGTTTNSQPFACVLYKPLLWIAGTGAVDDFFESDTTATIAAVVPLQASSGTGTLGCLTVFCSSAPTTNGAPAAHNMTFTVAQG